MKKTIMAIILTFIVMLCQVSCKPSLPDKPNDNENSPAEETAFIKRLNFSIGVSNTPSGTSQNYPTEKYIDEKRATAIDALNAVK